MMAVRKTDEFLCWIEGLRDLRGRAKIQVRIERLRAGNPGDVRPVGSGVPELRINYGPGYRIYFVVKNDNLVVLLAGGDKSSQQVQIDLAISLSENL
jgi:putative addiction module killer protein